MYTYTLLPLMLTIYILQHSSTPLLLLHSHTVYSMSVLQHVCTPHSPALHSCSSSTPSVRLHSSTPLYSSSPIPYSSSLPFLYSNTSLLLTPLLYFSGLHLLLLYSSTCILLLYFTPLHLHFFTPPFICFSPLFLIYSSNVFTYSFCTAILVHSYTLLLLQFLTKQLLCFWLLCFTPLLFILLQFYSSTPRLLVHFSLS